MKRFFYFILSIQIAIMGLICLDKMEFHIPILRQLIGFIYLTIVPGILILRILRFSELSISEYFLYSVGLSLTSLMFIGLVMNFVLPVFDIYNPISENYLIFILTVVVLTLCFVSNKIKNNISSAFVIKVQDILSPITLFLCIIPLFSIFGTYLVNIYKINIGLIFLFLILCLLAFLVAFDKIIERFYSLTIYVIALSLLYSYSLISSYICGYDIHHEYYISSLVMKSGLWNTDVSMNTNSMLSITMLAPIYSNICALDLTWVFKLIYPLIYSLVPLGMYHIFKKQTDAKIAFYSCFFFMSVFVFYTEMLALARQQIAEFFLVLIILLIINEKSLNMNKSILFLGFTFSLSVSHYSLSYIFMFQVFLVWFMLIYEIIIKKNAIKSMLSLTSISAYVVFTISWYIYLSSSSSFVSFLNITADISHKMFTELFTLHSVEGARIILKDAVSPLHNVSKYLHLTSQFFICAGIVSSTFRNSILKFNKEYSLFSYVSFMICIAAIFIPSFASSLNTSRLYHISLIFLSPMMVIGFLFLFRKFYKYFYNTNLSETSRLPFVLISTFLTLFLLFNSGWVYEIANDRPISISLSQNSILSSQDVNDINSFYVNGGYTSEQSVFGAEWLSNVRNNNYYIYSDYLHKSHVLQSYGAVFNNKEIMYDSKIENNSYLYIGYYNTIYSMYSSSKERKYWKLNNILNNNRLNILYSNGNCKIFSK